MEYAVERQNAGVERVVDTGDYQDFQGLKFRVIELPPREQMDFVIDEPTYIIQSTGAINVTANAPTVINGSTGEITLDAYAPVLIRGCTGEIDAYLRENTGIEGSTGVMNIRAAPHLELVADHICNFNGVYNQWGPVHLDAPEGNKGFILFKGGHNLNFSYDGQTGLHLPNDVDPKALAQRVKALLSSGE